MISDMNRLVYYGGVLHLIFMGDSFRSWGQETG